MQSSGRFRFFAIALTLSASLVDTADIVRDVRFARLPGLDELVSLGRQIRI
jgi:hypothetical protein